MDYNYLEKDGYRIKSTLIAKVLEIKARLVCGLAENHINDTGLFTIGIDTEKTRRYTLDDIERVVPKTAILDVEGNAIPLEKISNGTVVKIVYEGMILEMSPAIIEYVNSVQIADKSDYISDELPEGVDEYMEEFRTNFDPDFDVEG